MGLSGNLGTFLVTQKCLYSILCSSILQRGKKWLKFFELGKFQGLYYVNSVALFLKVPFFCFLGFLLNKEVADPFLRLKSFFFLMQDVEAVDYCNPNPLQYH